MIGKDDKDATDSANVTRLDDTGPRKLRYRNSLRLFKAKIDHGVEFGATSSVKIYKFVKPRAEWRKRLRKWFKLD